MDTIACRLLRHICPAHDETNPKRHPTADEFRAGCMWVDATGGKAYRPSSYGGHLCMFYRHDLCGWCDFIGGSCWIKR